MPKTSFFMSHEESWLCESSQDVAFGGICTLNNEVGQSV